MKRRFIAEGGLEVGLEVEEEGGLDGGLSGMILFLADEGSRLSTSCGGNCCWGVRVSSPSFRLRRNGEKDLDLLGESFLILFFVAFVA